GNVVQAARRRPRKSDKVDITQFLRDHTHEIVTIDILISAACRASMARKDFRQVRSFVIRIDDVIILNFIVLPPDRPALPINDCFPFWPQLNQTPLEEKSDIVE